MKVEPGLPIVKMKTTKELIVEMQVRIEEGAEAILLLQDFVNHNTKETCSAILCKPIEEIHNKAVKLLNKVTDRIDKERLVK